MEKERIIKKYPNRRLYDTVTSAYVTLEDIRRLVREGAKFRVVDAKTRADITRSLLLQIFLEQEERSQPIFTREVLEQIIRIYGDAMQGFMSAYLEESLAVFLRQQKLLEKQLFNLIEVGPLSAFGRTGWENLRRWRCLSEVPPSRRASSEDADNGMGLRSGEKLIDSADQGMTATSPASPWPLCQRPCAESLPDNGCAWARTLDP